MPRPCDAPERRLTYKIMSRIYGLLSSGEWQIIYVKMFGNQKLCAKLSLDSNTVGTVDPSEQVIFVDFREDILATVVHECIHVFLEDRFPGDHDAEEKETQRLEKIVMANMSRCQATRLHHLISLCLTYEERISR